jgi:hypothetical protein
VIFEHDGRFVDELSGTFEATGKCKFKIGFAKPDQKSNVCEGRLSLPLELFAKIIHQQE